MRSDLAISGSLFTAGFVERELPALMSQMGCYPADLPGAWKRLRPALEEPGGPVRAARRLVTPLARAFGYHAVRDAEPVRTRDGLEDGGLLMSTDAGSSARIWPVPAGADLDTPSKPDDAASGSPVRRAIRVLRASGENAGLVTNGQEVRLLLCDPSGPAGQILVQLDGVHGWAAQIEIPDSFRLFAGLASPPGMSAMGAIFEAARLHQTSVTRDLRARARTAIEDFLRHVLDHNRHLCSHEPALLWRQALTVVYRLLFILKLESAAEPGRGFSFAASESWRRAFSPNRALGPLVRRHLDLGQDTGRLLQDGLRILFDVCREGLAHGALSVAPLGGALFDPAATATIDALDWGERAAAVLLDRLLWTEPKGRPRERVHYGALDVEILGFVYESLLDLVPDIASVPMIRTRRGRLETVLPATHGAEGIPVPAGQFFTRTGLSRRAGGSYYTPHGFVSYLVEQTLAPLVTGHVEPAAILRIKVIDPAMGSGHFLVEACRFLATALYDACRRQDAPEVFDPLLAAYLPGRTNGRAETGQSRARAMAICRRLVATHCLYGVDRDPLAVELAKVSLWLESFAEGLPLTFLNHRLVAGDSIAGPFFKDLTRLPVGGGELDPLLARGVGARLSERVLAAMAEVATLDATIGTTLAEVMAKERAKARLDGLMEPLIALSQAWSGAVMSDARDANDIWLGLAIAVVDGTFAPDHRQRGLIARGRDALPMDLVFPEVFRPGEGGGFHAVLGNPPWDVVHYQTKEYLAVFDSSVMEAPTKRERSAIERRLLADPAISAGFAAYKAEFVERKRLCDRLFPGAGGAGSVDLFHVFTERMLDMLGQDGGVGMIVPSAFHANEGTLGLRRRVLNEMRLEGCFSFENRRKLFDIHGRLKFTLLLARRAAPGDAFRCGFYLDSPGQLRDQNRIMTYDRAFLRATGGAAETFLELSGARDLQVARRLFAQGTDMSGWLAEHGIVFGREAHMTGDSHRFIPASRAVHDEALLLHEGKTFHQFTDRWKTGRRYAIPRDAMLDKPGWMEAARYFRLAYREIARSTDERTMIAAMIPPGTIFGHKATCEKAPWARADSTALVLAALFNSFSFDWCLRRRAAASVSLFMVKACPTPKLSQSARRFLAHGALRLSCHHAEYQPLWHAQVGVPFPTTPCGADTRAAMDAVVARAYGLDRSDYQHILGGFSHASDPVLPDRCLNAYDELIKGGARAFYARHDPFANVPLPETRAQPVIASPTASATLIPSMPADMIPPA